jgi:cytochrome c oxidase assembly factor CtaG
LSAEELEDSYVLQFAHGVAPPNPSTWWLEWPAEPAVWAAIGLAAWGYVAAARTVRGWPRVRLTHFSLGLAVLFVALASPIATFDSTLFWVHMVQHLLLTLVAAPLLVMGAPVALALRATNRRVRRRLQALLHSPVARVFGHPVVAWLVFACVMVLTHFTPLYDAALENEWVHLGEHALYLGSALLFWLPVMGLDPSPGRLSPPLRLVYLLLVLPQQAFLGLAIYSARGVLYYHYATVQRTWGPAPLADQQTAAVIMWIGGEAILVVALVIAAVAWMRYDDRAALREDRRLGLG